MLWISTGSWSVSAKVTFQDDLTASATESDEAGLGLVEVAGRIKWFDVAKGFGFLTRGEGTEDMFLHTETVRRYGLTELKPGDSVLVRYGGGPKGLMEAEVRPLDAKSVPSH